GHNLCLDTFGGPSDAEAAAGMTVHGEASVIPHQIAIADGVLTQTAVLLHAQLNFHRQIRFVSPPVLHFPEEDEHLSSWDRPIAWTQHVTLGPPFIERGKTQFHVSATRSKVIEHDFTAGKGYMKIAAEFDWPNVPTHDGKRVDMRVFPDLPVSGAF